MNKIQKFILEDVRCFEGKKEFNIRPMTFLVGENSTGKSTVLGCMQALVNSMGLDSKQDLNLDFNVEPYQMGAFADIARKTGGRGVKCDHFGLGFEIQANSNEIIHLNATLTERESGSEPSIERLEVEFEDVLVVFEISGRQDDISDIRYIDITDRKINKSTTENGKPVYTFEINSYENWFMTLCSFMFFEARSMGLSKHYKELSEILKKILKRLSRDGRNYWIGGDPYADPSDLFPPYNFHFDSFAPIRSKPMRTYDPVKEVEDPEGSGMPMTLMNMYQNDKKGWKNIQKKLVKFGKDSGLFTDINIKKHGRSVSDPFQLQVKARGPQVNIVDVGYGISQVLPILVRILQAKEDTTFLVQQPEVHLHPKGQAELCSLLIDIAQQRSQSFVLETHSDAIINRARIEIMKGRLAPEDVSLIYFEPAKRNKVEVHNIGFDEQANMIGVPGSYRDFFLNEHNELLGFGS